MKKEGCIEGGVAEKLKIVGVKEIGVTAEKQKGQGAVQSMGVGWAVSNGEQGGVGAFVTKGDND